MLDLKFIRENFEVVKDSLKKRNLNLDLNNFIEMDDKRRKALLELEDLRARKNKANEEITKLLKEKSDPKEKIASMKDTASKIGSLEKEVKEYESIVNRILLTIPNIPHNSLPVGDASVNKVVRSWGEPKKIAHARSHIELAEHLDIIDFTRAAKLTASNFILYKGDGARLERSLYNFMLDLHTSKHGYTEIFHPQQTKMDNRVQALYRLPQRFALFVGTLEPRKNIRMMIEALSDYRKYTGDSLPLVLAGKSTRSFNAIPSEEKKETIALGYVPSEHRPSLYRLATTLFPSLYEGFGLPALESMACGTPVITSRTSSMPEVVGNAAISIDPHSRNDLVSALEHLMGSPILRQTLIERGLKRVENFSWEQCALKTMKVLEMVSKR